MAELEQLGLKDPPPRWFFICPGRLGVGIRKMAHGRSSTARDRTSCVAAQGSRVKVAAGNAGAAWPAMAWPRKPHSVTATAATSLPSLGEGGRDPPFKWKHCP